MSAEKSPDTQAHPVASHEDTTTTPSNTASISEDEKKRNSSLALATESAHGDSAPASESVTAGVTGNEAQSNGPTSSDEGVEYPTGIPLVIVMVALCLVVLLVALDNTIIATAIPRITDDFKALDDVGWYGSAYLLTTCAFQLMFGRLYSFFPIKWVFLIAITIFEIGSAVCGAAPNSTALIIGRAVAGMGSAGIFSGALIIMAHNIPLEKRPIYSGFFGSMYGIASVAGPLMGGAFTDHVSWRWCFYINLPIGAATIFGILIFLKPPKQTFSSMTMRSRLRNLDPLGTALFMPGIICLLLALQWGGSKYNWANARIIALFILFVVLIAAFVAVQFWEGDKATVPPRIVNQRSMIFGSIFAISIGASFFLMMYYVPIWFQAIKQVSATKSGIMTIPMLLALVLCTIISGVGITKLGYYVPWGIASGVLATIGAGLLTTFTPATGHSKWIGYQVLYGAGTGLGYQLPMLIPQVVSPLEDIPVAVVVLTFAQILGGALFISVGQNIFSNRLVDGIMEHVPSLDPSIVWLAGATQIKNVVPPELLDGVLLAYNNALRDTWYAAVAMSGLTALACLGIEWRSVKGKKIDTSVAA